MNRILLGCAAAMLVSACVDTSTLVLPSALAKPSSEEPAPSAGLGLSGQDGVVTALANDDLLGSTLGTGGTVNNLLGGTNAASADLAGSATSLQPAGEPVDQAVQDNLAPQLAQLADPGLGASGEDSPVTQLLGGDLLGALIGTEGGSVPVLVAGTDGGVLGTALSPVTDSVPEGTSLEPATTPVIDAISTVEFPDTSGTGSSSSLAPVTDALGSTPALGDLLGTATGSTSTSGG